MLEGFVPFPKAFAQRYRAQGYWADRTIAAELEDACAKFADRTALIGQGKSVTYRELDLRATNLALNLMDLGLGPLDRVVVSLPNVIEFVYLYLALQKLGCIPIMALPAHRYREISQFVEISGAVASVTGDSIKDFSVAAMIGRIRGESETLKTAIIHGDAPEGFVSLAALIETPARRSPDELAGHDLDPAGPAVFLLSGGTTGIPKLIPRTHNDYIYNSHLASGALRVSADDIMLTILPVGHNLPLACPGLQGYLLNGATVVLDTSTRPERAFPLIAKHRITHVPVVPALLIKWINDPAIHEHDLSSVRVIQSGGQRLQPEIRKRTERLLPGCTVLENFGMAEGLLTYVRFDDPEEVRMETVGRPVCPDDEVRLLDEHDREVAPGAVGELCCRGPYTLRGYFGAPEHNARAFTSDGFYRSGDLMRRTPEGNYMVEGRRKDLINRGAEKISAEEIENLILMHPAVHNVACVAMPDPVLGERMCACVVLKGAGALTLGELIGFLDDQEIAKFKLPERLEIFDEFPLSNFGKVSKADLAELVVARMAE